MNPRNRAVDAVWGGGEEEERQGGAVDRSSSWSGKARGTKRRDSENLERERERE